MSKFKEKALVEARRIVSDLTLETPKGKIFQVEAFINGLSEEIENLWESDIKGAYASFSLIENGSLIYSGLTDESLSDPTSFSIPFSLQLEEHCSETVKMAENLLQLQIADKKNKLLDKLLKENKDENLQE